MTTRESNPLRVAVIGCGRPLGTEGASGQGMAHQHMEGFARSGRCALVAVADLSRENAADFVARHDPQAAIFEDYREMMRSVRPDVVSVCVWTHLHAEVVCALAAFKPRAIFCEKPMDIHWDAALRMHEVCQSQGVMLAFNHQRRFSLPVARVKEQLDAGAIGKLRRMDGAWYSLSDTGTHVLDLMFHLNGDLPAEWVLGQIDMRGAFSKYGSAQTAHGLCEFRFANGVRALLRVGRQHEEIGHMLRLVGDTGELEILFQAPWAKMRHDRAAGWMSLDPGESIHDDRAIHRGVVDVIRCLEEGTVPLLGSANALRPTEIIFATAESTRRRGRIDLPLPPGPCGLLTMLQRGEIETNLAESEIVFGSNVD